MTTTNDRSNNVSPSDNKHRRPGQRRRRRRSDTATEDFDEAWQFLQQFHSFASRSLEVIAEHSESGDDEEDFNMSFSRLGKTTMTKAATCSCLNALASSAASEARDATALEDGGDDWGFYFEDTPEPSESAPKTN